MVGRQRYDSITIKKSNRRGFIMILLVVVAAIAVGIFSANLRYKPPEHEKMAMSGEPTVDDSFLYKPLYSDFGYSFKIASNLYRQKDGSVFIYLTNPVDNDVYLMCEVYDMDTAELYYKSGLLSPGEYVERLKPQEEFENTFHNIQVKVYALNMDDYISEGTTELEFALQPW